MIPGSITGIHPDDGSGFGDSRSRSSRPSDSSSSYKLENEKTHSVTGKACSSLSNQDPSHWQFNIGFDSHADMVTSERYPSKQAPELPLACKFMIHSMFGFSILTVGPHHSHHWSQKYFKKKILKFRFRSMQRTEQRLPGSLTSIQQGSILPRSH